MSRKTIQLTDGLYEYLLSVSLRETDLMRRLREETAKYPEANMQISPDEGQFLTLLVQLMTAGKVLEIGVFTGYSSLAIAQGMPSDGRITACDISEDYTKVARRYWAEAGIEQMIDLHLRPAIETLEELLATGHAGTYDFVFIDADKERELEYYEKSLELVRAGGLIIIDNVLWDGRVIDPQNEDPDTVAIRRFNDRVRGDTRVSISMIPIADGVTIARKR